MLQAMLLSFLIATLSFAAEASQRLSAGPIEGQVINAKNGVPLEGVIVVVNWELTNRSDLPLAELGVAERVTDLDGRFRFSPWGPVSTKTGSRLDSRAPQLLLFKNGFQYLRLVNHKRADTQHLASEWNGKTLEMRPLPPDAVATLGPRRTVSKHSLSVNGLSIALAWAYHGKDCEWTQIPKMLIAVHKLKRQFERHGLWTDLRSIDDLPVSKKCGDPRDLLKDGIK